MKNNKPIYMVEIAGAGGIAHYTYNLLEHLKTEDITLFTGTTYELDDQERKFNVIGIFNRLRTNPLKLLKMYFSILVDRPQVVHFQLSQYPSFILLLVLLCRMLLTKVVITAHNVTSHESRALDQWIFGLLYRSSWKIIVHSNYSKKQLADQFSINTDRISVIDHGNYGFFSIDETSQDDIDNKPFNLLFFGYIREYKGLDILLEAIASPPLENESFTLTIAGKPAEPFDRYNDLIKSKGLEDKVTTSLGYLPFDEVGEYFQQASVVVLPYQHIDQSGVLHLAYACSKPVIVTSVGGFPEVVEEGQSGLIVAPGSVSELANAIARMIADTELTRKMGQRAGEMANTRFSWHDIGQKTEDLYHS